MENHYTYLSWDSDFLQIKTALITTENILPDNLRKILTELKKNNYKLAYWPAAFTETNFTAGKLNAGTLADTKLTYVFDLSNYKPTENIKNVAEYTANTVSDDLLKLCLQSGIYSRFRVDGQFPEKTYERMYEKWIEKSVNKQIADKIFVVHDNENISGFVTLLIKDNIAKIGLIAVDSNSRGRKVGSTLIDNAKLYLFRNNIKQLYVDTQAANTKACSFYEKNNFKCVKQRYYFHFWL